MPFLSYYIRFTQEGECRQLEFWTEKEQIWETHSAQLQKFWKFTENYFGIYKKYWAKKVPEGTHQVATRVGGAPYPPGCAPLRRGPPGRPLVPIFCYLKSFTLKKIIGKLSGRNSAATRRNLGGANLGLWQSCSAGETSLREGEIIAIVITNNSPILGRAISSNIFNSTISSQTLLHLLCSFLLPEL